MCTTAEHERKFVLLPQVAKRDAFGSHGVKADKIIAVQVVPQVGYLFANVLVA